jgi:hypothetical protein
MNQWIVRIACLWLVCSPARAFADTAGEAGNRLYLGGQGGLMLAGFGGAGVEANPSEGYLYGPGFSIGGLAGIRLSERLAAQLEVGFSVRAPSATIDRMEMSSYRLSYLEMPVLGRIVLPRLGRMEPHGMLGPSLGILLAGTVDLVDGASIDVSDRLEPVDIGVVVGVGATVAMGHKDAISFDLRYNQGLTTWNKTTSTDGEFVHRAFYFLAGYRADTAWF